MKITITLMEESILTKTIDVTEEEFNEVLSNGEIMEPLWGELFVKPDNVQQNYYVCDENGKSLY